MIMNILAIVFGITTCIGILLEIPNTRKYLLNLIGQSRDNEEILRKSLRLKQLMHEDFYKKTFSPHEIIIEPYKRFKYSEAIIHSIDNDIYPESNSENDRVSSWFKVELYNFYFGGLEVIIGIEKAIYDQNMNWNIIGQTTTVPANCKYIKVFTIGRISFSNIVEYDLEGDEHYGIPHIYCKYIKGVTPYSDIVYAPTERESTEALSLGWYLDNDMRKLL